jgi:hypothetical protein
MLLNLQNSFEDRECMRFLFWMWNVLLLLESIYSKFSQNSSAKRHVAACRFWRQFCANPRNVQYQPIGRVVLRSAVFKRVWCFFPIRKIYFANFNDEQRIFNIQIIQYSKLILVINKIVYLWPWINTIFHENCKQISRFYS